MKAPNTVSLSSLKKGRSLCSSDFLKPLLVTSSHTYEGHCCCTWSWDAPTLNLLLEQEQVKIVDLQNVSARVFLYLSSWYLDLAPPPGREVPETQHWISQRTKIRRLPPNQIRPFLFLPADHLLQFNLIEAFHRLLIEFGVKVAVSFLKVLAPILWNYCLPANLLPIRG